MALPLDYATAALRVQLLQVAEGGDLRLFKKPAMALDGGKGRLREAVEDAIAANCGAGPLHVAAIHGRIPVCAYLVKDLQFNVDATDELGDMEAFLSGIMDENIIPDDLMDKECYMYGREGNCEIVKVLLSKGADVNFYCHWGTPLHIAAAYGFDDAMKILLDHNADFGLLPIEVAASHNSRADVKILFPVTSRIPSVRDWSIDGIIAYVKSREEDDPILNMNPANMKLKANKAYRRKDYIAAARLYNTENPFLMMRWSFYLQDYEKARDAFADGLKLDPGFDEIENALREALQSLKISDGAKKDH
ncbi:hypothetical protein ACQ4PT_006546 [Festuca glaucescens]